ncbi:MAG: hypothetical protein ACK5C1_02025, partial [Bacteroidota bacterium]
MFRALTLFLTAAIGFANPAIAQYGGLDTTAKEAPTTTKSATTIANNPSPTPAEKTITLKRSLHPIQKEAMTFMWTNNSNFLVNNIAEGLQKELEPNFGNVGNSLI